MKGDQVYLGKDDLQAIADLLDKQTAVLATKDELKAQTEELKTYTNDAFETQQIYMDERFKEVIGVIDVRDRVDKLEKVVKDLKFRRKLVT